MKGRECVGSFLSKEKSENEKKQTCIATNFRVYSKRVTSWINTLILRNEDSSFFSWQWMSVTSVRDSNGDTISSLLISLSWMLWPRDVLSWLISCSVCFISEILQLHNTLNQSFTMFFFYNFECMTTIMLRSWWIRCNHRSADGRRSKKKR